MEQNTNDPFAFLANALKHAKNEEQIKNKDVTVERKGSAIILPNDPREMTIAEAKAHLTRIEEQEDKVMSISETIGQAWPLEGAYFLMEYLKEKYGWVNSVDTPGFFGPKPPTMMDLEIGFGKKTQVIWGSFEIPNISGRFETDYNIEDGRVVFRITGTAKKKHEKEIKAIADGLREKINKKSLYKNQAIKLVTDEDGEIDFFTPPKFMDLSKIDESHLTFSDEVLSDIQTNLFTVVEKTAQCRAAGIPLKRTVLLEGPYGTGKTLTAGVTAKKAVANGWTYLYLDKTQSIKDAMVYARQYAPAVVFAEDIENVVKTEDGRSFKVNDVLNNLDGVDSKGQEVICIFTTNHIDKIEPAMLRPGRLDAIITVNPPDKKAAEKLVRSYANGLIDKNEDLTSSSTELAGQIPATIREVVERAKLFAISRLTGGKLQLTDSDIKLSAISMKKHIQLMNPKIVETDNSPEATFTRGFSELLGQALSNNKNVRLIEEVNKKTEEVLTKI